MRIVADERMNGLEELIRPLGELVTAPGREIDRHLLADTDVLLVRSITPVSAALLNNSPVRFVGTATSGLDHVDQAFLAQQGIALADARGSNANAVVDYVLAALAELIAGEELDVRDLIVGIVGHGQVGRRLQSRLSALGIATRVCDPPLAAWLQASHGPERAASLVSLSEVLTCQVVSVHVPLQHGGEHATAPLLDRPALAALGPQRLLINTSRGGIVDEAAWLDLYEKNQAPSLISDVWCNEPHVDDRLVRAARLATPHIAGYSERAKRQATAMLADALLQFQQGNFAGQTREANEPQPSSGSSQALANSIDCWRRLADALPLAPLSKRFKQAVTAAGGDGLDAATFDGFRNDLRQRREFGELAPEALAGDSEGHGEGEQIKPEQVEFFRAAGFPRA
ncbi:MAG: hypothetical protein PsegKO_23180 [Pseudohongiellaceae bacterium]